MVKKDEQSEWWTGRMLLWDLVYSSNDFSQQDIGDAANHRDEVEHVPRITEVILHNITAVSRAVYRGEATGRVWNFTSVKDRAWDFHTSSSAIADRPHRAAGWVSFEQKWKTIFCWQYNV